MKTESSLTPNESLDLISEMITQAKGNLKNSSFYFLLWGWVIVICNFTIYLLIKFSHYERPYLIWLITIPAWALSFLYGHKNDKNAFSVSHLDNINKWLWISLGPALIPIIYFGSSLNYQINPLTLLITAVPTFVTGIILRFRPLIVGACVLYIFAVLSFIADYQTQYLLGGIAMILGFLIPGYALKQQKQ